MNATVAILVVVAGAALGSGVVILYRRGRTQFEAMRRASQHPTYTIASATREPRSVPRRRRSRVADGAVPDVPNACPPPGARGDVGPDSQSRAGRAGPVGCALPRPRSTGKSVDTTGTPALTMRPAGVIGPIACGPDPMVAAAAVSYLRKHERGS